MFFNALKCKCTYKDCKKVGPIKNISILMNALEKFQKRLFEINPYYRISINSGFRCAEHNKNVGGSPGSQHIKGLASDIRVRGMSSEKLLLHAHTSGIFDAIGVYDTFIHVDKRGYTTRWDKRTNKNTNIIKITP